MSSSSDSSSDSYSESESLHESEIYSDTESSTDEDCDFAAGLLNVGPRTVVHPDETRDPTTLRVHWVRTLDAVETIKETIPSGIYVMLVDFIKDHYSRAV